MENEYLTEDERQFYFHNCKTTRDLLIQADDPRYKSIIAGLDRLVTQFEQGFDAAGFIQIMKDYKKAFFDLKNSN